MQFQIVKLNIFHVQITESERIAWSGLPNWNENFVVVRVIYVPMRIIICYEVEQVLLLFAKGFIYCCLLGSNFTITVVPSSEACSCLRKCVISSALMIQQWLEAPSLPGTYEYFGSLNAFFSNLDSSIWSTLNSPWTVQ